MARMKSQKESFSLLDRVHLLQLEFMRRDPDYKRDYEKLFPLKQGDERIRQHVAFREKYGLFRLEPMPPPYLTTMVSAVAGKDGMVKPGAVGVDDPRMPHPVRVIVKSGGQTSVVMGEGYLIPIGVGKPGERDPEQYELDLRLDLRRTKEELLTTVESLIDQERNRLQKRGYQEVHRRQVIQWENYLAAWDKRNKGYTFGEIARALQKSRATVQTWVNRATEIIERKSYVGFANSIGV